MMALVCYTEEIYLNNIYVNNIIHERSLIGQTYIQTHKTDIGGKCSELPAGATPQTQCLVHRVDPFPRKMSESRIIRRVE